MSSTPRINIVSRPKRKILVTWSGGLDSTYGLIRTLRETDYEVYCHHTHRVALHELTRKPTLRPRFETEAVNRMLPLIRQKHRDFAYTESVVDLRGFDYFAPDAVTTFLFAAAAAKRHGFTGDDLILDINNSDEDAHWSTDILLAGLLRMNVLQTMKTAWGSEDTPMVFTFDPVSKAEEIAYVSPEVMALNASCRDPVLTETGWRTCGRCMKCISIGRAMRHLKATGSLESKDVEVPGAEDRSPPADVIKRLVDIRPAGKTKTLVMWSGGPASTAALRKVLAETEDDVHVHHILSSARQDCLPDGRSFGGHDRVEAERVLAELRKAGHSFSVSSSTIGPPQAFSALAPISVVAYFAAQRAASWHMLRTDRVVFGTYGDAHPSAADNDALYRDGQLVAAQMIKLITRSADVPRVTLVI